VDIESWAESWDATANVAAGGFGAVATVAAAVSLWMAGKWNAETRRSIARERRREYELDLLKELAEMVALDEVPQAGRTERIRLRLRLLGPGLLPVNCALQGLPSTPRAEDVILKFNQLQASSEVLKPTRHPIRDRFGHESNLMERLHEEIDEAIRERIQAC